MSRWPDAPITSAFHYVLANKRGYRKTGEIFQKAMALKLSRLVDFWQRAVNKHGGERMKVSSIMLLKTNGGKMSENGLSIIWMKTNIVTVVFPLS